MAELRTDRPLTCIASINDRKVAVAGERGPHFLTIVGV
jgi:hypothetical protein